MATAIDVAQYIYNKVGWIDAWSLAMLTYYSQAWSLGWSGRPIITDEFQAWADGPVVPNLNSETKTKGSDSTPPALPSADLGRLSDTDEAIIDSVVAFYGAFSKEELVERTQAELPWLEARKGVLPGEPSRNPVSQSTMKAYYALQELQSDSVPVRPEELHPKPVGHAREKLFNSADRWSTALELLADK